MTKLPQTTQTENTIVHVTFTGADRVEYECVGVLIRDEAELIRVAFNAVHDHVRDFLDITRTDIISMQVVDPAQVEEIR